jgi:hypothetical protein
VTAVLFASGSFAVVTASPPTDTKAEPSNKEKTVGIWEFVKSTGKNPPPPGSTVEFTKDGKVKVSIKADKQAITGTTELKKDFRGKFEEVSGKGELTIKPDKDGKAHPVYWAAFTLSGSG